MFAPPIYIVRKLPFADIVSSNYNLQLGDDEQKKYLIKQSDNLLFRQIRLITYEHEKYNKFIVFVDCSSGKNHPKEMRKLIQNGFKIGRQEFIVSERSASMVRTGILSFVDKHVERELSRRISMGMEVGKTALSKLYAYKGLALSSCHCIENWYPNIVVVPDCMITIPAQKIKYVYDKHIQFVDANTGADREWIQKDIAQTEKDIEINAFDGCGLAHPLIMQEISRRIGSDEVISSAILRGPGLKGVIHSMDYERFFASRGVRFITDIWGVQHDVSPGADPMIILTEGQYKYYKYFKKTGTIDDWEEYWFQFRKNQHCLGIAKWNFSSELEPLFTRLNYQVLQDLNLDYDDFKHLADDSIDWYERIAAGDPLYTYCFLGMKADKHKPLNSYCEAILKNTEMLKEEGVRDYILGLLQKYKDEFKCGKLWQRATFKFLAPDLIMLMEHIGGLPLKGCLESNEFYSFDRTGIFSGERLIERNPHICKSEHVILTATNNELLETYCSHLVNVAIVNCKSITPQRLNGADYDGDLVCVVDNPLMMKGVDREAQIVIDIEDKVTALAEEDTVQNKINCIMRGLRSDIGEISNYATAYHNKVPKSEESKARYANYVELLSVVNGKSIDFAKTGVKYPVPKQIQKYGRPLPYFMKYASPYYQTLKKFSYARSNMNQLCIDIENWEHVIRRRKTRLDFDWHIMIDEEVGYTEEHFAEIEKIYKEFYKTCKDLKHFEHMCKNYDKYRIELQEQNVSKEIAKVFEVDWEYYYGIFRNRCQQVCHNAKELANIAVTICYEKYPKRSKKFIWRMAGRGIVDNLKQQEVLLPYESADGDGMYLGRTYSMIPMMEQVDDPMDGGEDSVLYDVL